MTRLLARLLRRESPPMGTNAHMRQVLEAAASQYGPLPGPKRTQEGWR